MGIFARLFGMYAEAPSSPTHVINPASGLPMVDDCTDVAGNIFGTDAQVWDSHPDMDCFGSGICMGEDLVSPFTDDL